MEFNDKDLLQKTYELAKENNKFLHEIRRSHHWSVFFRIFYWVLIIGFSIGAYYYFQPYLDTVLKAYKTIQSSLGSLPR